MQCKSLIVLIFDVEVLAINGGNRRKKRKVFWELKYLAKWGELEWIREGTKKLMLAHLRPFRWNANKALNLEKTLSKYTPILWKFCSCCFYYQKWAFDFLFVNLRTCKRSCSHRWKWRQWFLEIMEIMQSSDWVVSVYNSNALCKVKIDYF